MLTDKCVVVVVRFRKVLSVLSAGSFHAVLPWPSPGLRSTWTDRQLGERKESDMHMCRRFVLVVAEASSRRQSRYEALRGHID